MQLTPFLYVRQSPRWKVTLHPARIDLDSDLVFTVDRVEVRWRMITVVHCNDDAKKAAELRACGYQVACGMM